MRRRLLIVLGVFLAVFAVRAAYWAQLEASPLSEWYLWKESDEFGNLEWSSALASGRWLDVPAFRSYFSWQVPFGGPEVWEAWYPKNSYFQTPLYAYGLALLRRSFGSPVLPARLLQLLLACLTAAVVAWATERVASRRASGEAAGLGGAAAGLLYGLYAPSLFHDGFLLRDGPFAHASTLVFALALASSAPGLLAAFSLGLLAAATILLRQTVLFLALGAVVLAVSRHEEKARRRRAGMAALAGLALPLAAFVARNVWVGAPPLTFDTRQAIGIIWGNARGADATTAPPDGMRELLSRAHGSTSAAVTEVLRSYRGHAIELPLLFAKKLATFLHVYEIPDNASFAFFRAHFPTLRLLPIFPCVFGLGLIGLLWARRERVISRAEAILVLLAFAGPLVAALLVQAVSRYRLPLAGPLAVGAGLAVALSRETLARGERRAVVRAAGLSLLLAFVPLVPAVIPTPAIRASDAIVAATLREARGDLAGAADEIRRYLEKGADDPQRSYGMVQAYRWMVEGERRDANVAPEGVAPPEKRVRAKR